MGLEGGLLSRYLRIMTTHGRPLAPIMGAGGRSFVPVSADYDDHGRPLAPITGLEGGLLSPLCGHYGDKANMPLRIATIFRHPR